MSRSDIERQSFARSQCSNVGDVGYENAALFYAAFHANSTRFCNDEVISADSSVFFCLNRLQVYVAVRAILLNENDGKLA